MADLTPQKAYEILVDYCDKVARAKYILSSTAIKNLLRYIANTPCLYNYVAKCNQSIVFKDEYFKFLGDDSLNLPANPMAIVSVVTALLYDFDRAKIDIDKFLRKYFNFDDYEARYQRFCFTILTAYARAFEKVITYKEAVIDAEEDVSVDNYAKESIMPYLSQMMEVVENDNHISDSYKKDIMIMLDGLYYSFELSRTKMIKVAWIGLTYTVKSYKPIQSYLKEVKKRLEQFALI